MLAAAQRRESALRRLSLLLLPPMQVGQSAKLTQAVGRAIINMHMSAQITNPAEAESVFGLGLQDDDMEHTLLIVG